MRVLRLKRWIGFHLPVEREVKVFQVEEDGSDYTMHSAEKEEKEELQEHC